MFKEQAPSADLRETLAENLFSKKSFFALASEPVFVDIYSLNALFD